MLEYTQMLLDNLEIQLNQIAELQNITDEEYLEEYEEEFARQESLYPYEDFGK